MVRVRSWALQKDRVLQGQRKGKRKNQDLSGLFSILRSLLYTCENLPPSLFEDARS